MVDFRHLSGRKYFYRKEMYIFSLNLIPIPNSFPVEYTANKKT